MHEQAIAKALIEEAQRHGAVVGIEVHCGELAHLPADELREALSLLTDWELEVIESPGEVKCGCGFGGRPRILEKGHDHTIFDCPQCHTKLPRIIGGDQIVLAHVDVKRDE